MANKDFSFSEEELAYTKLAMQMASECYAYLLKIAVGQENELNEGNYSDKLRLAIEYKGFMAQFKEKK